MKKLIFAILLLMSGCKMEGNYQGKVPYSSTGSDGMQYFKDMDTGICFAFINERTDTLTSVPCTPEVENRIKLLTKPKNGV